MGPMKFLGVIQRATDVSETVKKIFDNKFGILQIKKQINTRYKINVDIDFASVAFITDIQSDFFRTRIQQKKNKTPNDTLQNIEALRKKISLITKDVESVYKFIAHKVQPWAKNRQAEDGAERVLSDYIINQIFLDPIFYLDCGIPFVKSYATMLLSI